MNCIYALVDPRTKAVRYIGQAKDLDQRYRQHCERIENTPKGKWVQELKGAGLVPHVHILENVNEEKRTSYSEKWWIAVGKRQGWELLNVANPTRDAAKFEDLFASALVEMYVNYDRFSKPVIVIRKYAIVVAACIVAGLFATSAYFELYYGIQRSSALSIAMDYVRGVAVGTTTSLSIFAIYRHSWDQKRYALLAPSALLVIASALKIVGAI